MNSHEEFWIQEKRPVAWIDYARKESACIVKSRIEELKREKPGQKFRGIVRTITIAERPI